MAVMRPSSALHAAKSWLIVVIELREEPGSEAV
jgi:hypothetical protein